MQAHNASNGPRRKSIPEWSFHFIRNWAIESAAKHILLWLLSLFGLTGAGILGAILDMPPVIWLMVFVFWAVSALVILSELRRRSRESKDETAYFAAWEAIEWIQEHSAWGAGRQWGELRGNLIYTARYCGGAITVEAQKFPGAKYEIVPVAVLMLAYLEIQPSDKAGKLAISGDSAAFDYLYNPRFVRSEIESVYKSRPIDWVPDRKSINPLLHVTPRMTPLNDEITWLRLQSRLRDRPDQEILLSLLRAAQGRLIRLSGERNGSSEDPIDFATLKSFTFRIGKDGNCVLEYDGTVVQKILHGQYDNIMVDQRALRDVFQS